jgi:hypothetical protein
MTYHVCLSDYVNLQDSLSIQKVILEIGQLPPAGYRVMTVCEAEVFKSSLLLQMGTWDIISVLGGTISGTGYGGVVTWNAGGGMPVPILTREYVFVIEVRQIMLA